MNINAKIKQVRAHFCGGSNTKFAKLLGETSSTTSNWCKDEYSIGMGVITKIVNTFPDVNLNWLAGDDNNMLKSSLTKSKHSVKKNSRIPLPPENNAAIAELQYKLNAALTEIDLLKELIKSKDELIKILIEKCK
jgi:hypothetical protein